MYENEKYDEFDLKYIIQILRKRIKAILIVPIVLAMAGAAVSVYFIDPVYESSTTIIVRQNKDSNEEISKTDVDLSKSLIYTYAEMTKSNTVLENTRLALNLTELDGESIRVSPVRDTQILKVSVQNTDPKLAAEIADTLVTEFTNEIIRITKTDNVAVVDYAIMPLNPVKPDIVLNTVIAAAFGEMIALFAVFVAEYLDNTIKTEKDITKCLGIAVIGSVPDFTKFS
ncbi:MAG: hypothetical protein K0R07_233 [Sedimentibacter sp.]|jgi:capsular polysaccharide biosynthesis protein|nr:hypothetical protein [Sedimentibacter sp.]